MPITKIHISFDSVYVKDSADIWGDGEWHFTATIDGNPVGSPNTEFVAQEKTTIQLPPADWGADIDVSGKKVGDTIKCEFSGIDKDVISDDDLGKVTVTFAYPFTAQAMGVDSPTMKGFLGLFSHNYYALNLSLTVLEEKATATLSGDGSVAVSRQADGSVTFSTVAGPLLPRVEVCPVVPPPAPPSAMPPRPPLPPALAAGVDTTWAIPIQLLPAPANFNDLVNPSVIPALAADDPDLASKAAKIAVTHLEPGDLDVTQLTWTVKSGPAEIVAGSNTGPWVLVRGTSGAAADAMAEIEVRWGTDKGPPLCTYRAWVGAVKTALYRVNIIDPPLKTGTPPPPPPPAQTPTTIVTPQDIDAQMKVAAVLLWQVGIDLKPDTNATPFDGAVTTDSAGAALPAGIFRAFVKTPGQTTNVDIDHPSLAGHLNFRPGVLNVAYIRHTPAGRAAAQDILGVAAHPPDEQLGGTPSVSWVIPSGILPITPPDGPAQTVKMAIFPQAQQKTHLFDQQVKARNKADPSFTAAALNQLYAVVVPADWGPTGNWANRGVNLAHELGHALGLYHRGSGGHDDNKLGTSDDKVSSTTLVNGKTKKYGHPWNENIMSYGYTSSTFPRALDFDLLQATVLRRHPACT